MFNIVLVLQEDSDYILNELFYSYVILYKSLIMLTIHAWSLKQYFKINC